MIKQWKISNLGKSLSSSWLARLLSLILGLALGLSLVVSAANLQITRYQILFQDDFASGLSNWIQIGASDGTWTVIDTEDAHGEAVVGLGFASVTRVFVELSKLVIKRGQSRLVWCGALCQQDVQVGHR